MPRVTAKGISSSSSRSVPGRAGPPSVTCPPRLATSDSAGPRYRRRRNKRLRGKIFHNDCLAPGEPDPGHEPGRSMSSPGAGCHPESSRPAACPAWPGRNRPTAALSLRMSSSETKFRCVSCGDELHPERAEKYDYCMKPECQAKNLKGLTMVAVGVNKSAEQYLLLDEDTKAELAQGKYHDQRRGTFGQPAGPGQPRAAPPGRARPGQHGRQPRQRAPASTGQASAPGQPARPAHPAARPPHLAGPGCRARRRSAGWRSCTTSRACGRTRSPASWG